MRLIRPVRIGDLDALVQLARGAGVGFTSLPPVPEFLLHKIERSERSFAANRNDPESKPGQRRYLLVLEDSDSREIEGCCAIEAECGLDEAFYSYRLGLAVHASRELGIYRPIPTLYLSNDLTGSSVLTSLYLKPERRGAGSGPLLSRCRLLLMASFPQQFSSRLIAEMRGVSDEHGHSPFWEGLGRHFFGVDYGRAEHIVGTGNKAFIAELMPPHPIYTVLLPESARAVMGQVHPQTRPALRLLEQEGFRHRGYIDIFDGGPTVEAPVDSIRSIQQSRVVTATVGGANSDRRQPCLIANLRLDGFRCTAAAVAVDADSVRVPAEVAGILDVSDGELVRVLAL